MKIIAWISFQLARLKRCRIVLDLAMVITIIGLLLAVVSFYRSELSNNSIIETLNQIIDGQRETLEIIRIRDELPPKIASNKTNSASDRKPSSIHQIKITKYYEEINPPQLEVQGSIYKQNESEKYWIGILSGLQLWPQIRLTDKTRDGVEFKYRISVPGNVKTGAIVLLAVGESTDKSFVGYQDYAVVNTLRDVGFYFPHLSDITTMSSEEFKIKRGSK
ncbi:MAG: hypothetical protein KKE44_02875 [Proteobacteria bacterium]|nr:hypothetical protein [Pseudomonadota bacterium]MBU1581670.1 hypothetical protein [Pseudomonadota bacterium]MBU2451873.1 hypothetical protein [Pseudomonadota bacterium]MBU2628608.1 hypothetical protein [Pseudomonadota bacterium]